VQSNKDIAATYRQYGLQFLSCNSLIARSLECHERVGAFRGEEYAKLESALLRTLATLSSFSWRLDPRIQLYGRIKCVASISNKMSTYGLGVHQVLDIIGVRAVTQHTRDCYQLVDRIHSEFNVLASQYDDYIAAPKPNGYRSIHTTVITLCGFPVEIQIRTLWMHALCEKGPAAHSQYKPSRTIMEVPRQLSVRSSVQ
jgi:GTP pyrophosphokinase